MGASFLYRLINKSSAIKMAASIEIPLIIRCVREAEAVSSVRQHIVRVLYRLALHFSSKIIFLPKKSRLVFQGIECLQFNNNPVEAISKWNEAIRLGQNGIDAIVRTLARIELSTHENCGVENAKTILIWAASLFDDYHICYELALQHLRAGNVEDSVPLLMHAIELNPCLAMSHQNMAARYDSANYILQRLDLIKDPELHLYDAYHMLGQILYNSGEVEDGIKMFGCAMNIQNSLANRYSLPQHLIDKMAVAPLFVPGKPIRIVPYEWVTQIGHMGMLDALIKMSKLGLRPDANWILLAPDEKVVNRPYLEYWRAYFIIVSDYQVCQQLLPYQRIYGEQFNCFIDECGQVMDWSDAASMAFREWDSKGYAPLVRVSIADSEYGQRKLEVLGLPKGAWFVTLHVRTSGYYREGLGFIQDHRNSPTESYLPAIDLIVKNGGWVVRMGDSSMPKLPRTQNVIDVAHSALSSRRLDLYLWSKCRFFLGTTSGPTNVVISFNTPCLLVNCISNYAQSWNNRVIFVLKPIWSRVLKRYLSYKEVFIPSYRATMFSTTAMSRVGIEPHSNSARDILDATTEMLNLLHEEDLPGDQDHSLANSFGVPIWLWGNAMPSWYYLKNHRDLLFLELNGSPSLEKLEDSVFDDTAQRGVGAPH